MNIKAILISEDKEFSITITPKWLLENGEEELVEEIICTNQCGLNYKSTDESGEPHCYGECLDRIYEIGYSIKFEDVNEN